MELRSVRRELAVIHHNGLRRWSYVHRRCFNLIGVVAFVRICIDYSHHVIVLDTVINICIDIARISYQRIIDLLIIAVILGSAIEVVASKVLHIIFLRNPRESNLPIFSYCHEIRRRG